MDEWFQFADKHLAIAIIVFIGMGCTWIAKRLFSSKDGILSKLGENLVETNARNSITLAKLEETSKSQQALCTRHANLVAAANDGLASIGSKLTDIGENTEAMSDKWAGECKEEYKVLPALDAAIKTVDMIERVAERENWSWRGELKTLRTDIERIREKVTSHT